MKRSRHFAALAIFAIVALPLPAIGVGFDGRASDIVSRMSLEEKAGQVLLVGVGGRGSAPPSSLSMIRDVGPGGIILFGFNIPDDPTALCPALRRFQTESLASGSGLPLLVAVDDEGGSVFRFKGGITRPPSPLETARRGAAYAALLGTREALELGDLGINTVLGPVVEPLTDDDRLFLGDRSYGRDPAKVDAIASAYIRGLGEGGAIAAAKHFPADGPADPHLRLPRLSAPEPELEGLYLDRFAGAIAAGARVVMISHIVVEAVDPNRPATLSPAVIAILRRRLGFRGVALTDDLYMKALGMSPEVSAPLALAAGDDLLMLSSSASALSVREAIVEAVRRGLLSEARLDEAARRVVALKLSSGLDTAVSEASGRCASFAARVAESARLLGAFSEPSP